MTEENKKNIESIDYSMPFLKSKRFLTICAVLLFITVFSGVSLTKKIDDTIYGLLSSNPRCPISLSNYEIKFFLPRLELNSLKIPRSCSRSLKKDIVINKTTLHVRGFAFSPLGLHFKVETVLNNNPISTYLTVGLSEIQARLTDNNIKLQNFKDFIPLVKLRGDIKLDALISLKNLKLDTLKLNARSKNFKIPSQSIMGLNINQLNIDHIKVILDSKEGKQDLDVKELIIGKANSPIEANFKGSIKLNQKFFSSSSLLLNGELKTSKELTSKFPLIKMYLDSFDKKDDYYQIKIAGPISRPKLSSQR